MVNAWSNSARQLGQFNLGAKLNFVDQGDQSRVIDRFAPLAQGLGKVFQSVLGNRSHENLNPDFIEPVKDIGAVMDHAAAGIAGRISLDFLNRKHRCDWRGRSRFRNRRGAAWRWTNLI
ncbi:MAG: hypothetical protein VB959_00740 [Rhodospirillales bacterium]